MLRPVGADSTSQGVTGDTVRVSSGSAAVLEFAPCQLEVAPTTAYLMVGDKCSRNCAFCAQARQSTARADRLSRVVWPSYPVAEVLPALALAFDRCAIERACLQVTAGRGSVDKTRCLVRKIRLASTVPLCVCIRTGGLRLFEELLALGAERVTLALDAASERVYNRVKGRDWQKTLELLQSAARRYPGQVGTHVIAGLGETEAEVARLLQAMHDLGVTTALFAFTPVPGTALAEEPPPDLALYRRVQVARHLIVSRGARAEQFRFSADGRITSYGIASGALREWLRGGQAFQTSGCPGCNRPYYNERPGGPLYNYPRPLGPEEAAAATALVIDSLVDHERSDRKQQRC